MYKIPLFDLNYGKEEEEAVLKTLRSKWISMGSNVSKLEKEFAKHLNIKHAIAVTNCTASLHLALKILGIKEADEIIVPSLTFVATVNVIRYVNATPVFADITSYEDFSINPDDIEKKITSKTKAIIAMHYGGFACDMDRILGLAKKHNLYVIEDAAHAPDAEYLPRGINNMNSTSTKAKSIPQGSPSGIDNKTMLNLTNNNRDIPQGEGKKLGTIGDIGCFSFFSNKNITCAEGGMLATNNDEYAKKAKLLRAHGMTSLSYERAKGHATKYDVVELGYNYRMDDIRGALALSQFKKLKDDVKKREKLRQIYLEELKNVDNIIIPYKNHPYKSTNYVFPIVLKNSNAEKRDKVRQKLAEAGIQTSVHYPAVHRFSIYEHYKVSLPMTDYVTDNEITLPMFYNLSKDEIKYISESLKKIL